MRATFILIIFCTVTASGQDWMSLNGPYGGNINCMAQNASGQIFIGTNGGIFTSTDNGSTWSGIYNGLPPGQIRTIAIAPNGHLFAGISGSGGGLFRSMDNGANWTLCPGSFSPWFNSMAIANDGSLYIGGWGILRSMDNGDTWTFASPALTNASIRSITVDENGVLHIIWFGNGIHRSSDNGSTWQPLNNGLSLYVTDIGQDPFTGDLYAGSFEDGLFRLAFGSDTWVQLSFPLENTTYTFHFENDGSILVGTMNGVYRSLDQGANWTALNDGMELVLVLALMKGVQNDLFAGTALDGGVYRSMDEGLSWSATNTGIIATHIQAIAVDEDNLFVGSIGRGVHGSANGGLNWTELNNGSSARVINALALGNGGVLFSGTRFHDGTGGVHRSLDHGLNWAEANGGTLTMPIGSLSLIGDDLFATAYPDNGISRTSDLGESWVPSGNGLACSYAGEVLIAPSGDLYTWTHTCPTGGIYRSADGGVLWEATGPTAFTNITAMAIDGNEVIYFHRAGTGFFRSVDHGATWLQVNNGFNAGVTYAYDLIADASDRIYAATNNGIFMTQDGGNNWSTANDGLTSLMIRSLALGPDGYMYAGTMGGGIFKSALPTSTTDTRASAEARQLQNHPNPCHTVTTITFNSPGDDHAVLSILDATGRVVLEQPMGFHPSGPGRIEVNVSSLNNGVYVYRLRIGGSSQMGRMVVSR